MNHQFIHDVAQLDMMSTTAACDWLHLVLGTGLPETRDVAAHGGGSGGGQHVSTASLDLLAASALPDTSGNALHVVLAAKHAGVLR